MIYDIFLAKNEINYSLGLLKLKTLVRNTHISCHLSIDRSIIVLTIIINLTYVGSS